MARTIASERPVTPLLVTRVVSLLLACIFGLVGGALGKFSTHRRIIAF